MKKKQKEMYDDYKRNPVRSILKEKKLDEEEKGLKLYYLFLYLF